MLIYPALSNMPPRRQLRGFKLIASVTLCLLCAGAQSAFASSLWNVYTYANEALESVVESPGGPIVNVGGIISYNSNIAANGSPIGSSVDIFPGSGTTYSNPTALGLTSATSQVSSSTPVYGDYPGTVFSASALAKGNLATGSVGVSADGHHYCVGLTCTNTGATSSAQIMDTLTFHIAGANSSTATDIGVRFKIDGSTNPPAPVNNGIHANMTGTMDLGRGAIQYNFDTTAGYPAEGRILADGGWLSSTIVSQTPESFIFDGVYALDGSTVTLPVLVALQCATGGGSCDYANTAVISFDLPSNVTFISASGDFLTQPTTAVPEPVYWPMLAGILLVFTIAARRRFRNRHVL